jgi:hypothetical protein
MALRKSVIVLGVLIGGCQVAAPETDSKVEQFIKEPIIEGSGILLVRVEREFPYRGGYTLSTGGKISKEQLKLLREVASRFNQDKVDIAERLLHLTILKDEMEQTFSIGLFSHGHSNISTVTDLL